MALKDFGTLYGLKKNALMRAEWIKNVQTDHANIQEQQWRDISVEELQTALKKTHKWKAAGIHQVSNYWLNLLNKGHYILASLLPETIKNLNDSPAWLSKGITYLLPKANDRVNPKNYKPITCQVQLTHYLHELSQRKSMYSWRLMIYSVFNKKVAEKDHMGEKINS